MGRDAPRPDATRRLRRAAEGKGGAAWRRDRSRAQPRAATGFGREHGEHGEDPPLPAASTVAPLRQGQAELSTAQSSISS
jgi:hypothetical protein